MFKHLINFSYKRTAAQAFGFYITYFILLLLIITVLGGIFASDFDEGVRFGAASTVASSFILAFLVLYNKRRINHFGYFLLASSAGIIALFMGLLGALIPVAYLTTIDPAGNNINNNDPDDSSTEGE